MIRGEQMLSQKIKSQKESLLHTDRMFAYVGSRLGTSRPRKAPVNHSQASTF